MNAKSPVIFSNLVVFEGECGGGQQFPDGGDEALQVRLKLLPVLACIQANVLADLTFHLKNTKNICETRKTFVKHKKHLRNTKNICETQKTFAKHEKHLRNTKNICKTRKTFAKHEKHLQNTKNICETRKTFAKPEKHLRTGKKSRKPDFSPAKHETLFTPFFDLFFLHKTLFTWYTQDTESESEGQTVVNMNSVLSTDRWEIYTFAKKKKKKKKKKKLLMCLKIFSYLYFSTNKFLRAASIDHLPLIAMLAQRIEVLLILSPTPCQANSFKKSTPTS